jgi:hypothetical protein
MSHRQVVDAAGVAWELWEVQPALVERRESQEGATPSITGERRRMRSVRMRVSPAMRDGWLAIRSEFERRRIAPIPEGWASLSDGELLALVARAEVSGSPRRLIE